MKVKNIVEFAKRKAARDFENALSDQPIEEQIAAALVAKNILNGCSWAFCRMDPQLRRYEEAFENSHICSMQKITYNRQENVFGYLVSIDSDRLFELLGPGNHGPLTEDDVKIAKANKSEAVRAFMDRINSGYEGKIGIYHTADTQSVTVCGKTFPAYAITLRELCEYCEKKGYGIVIGEELRDPGEVLQKEDMVIENLLITPSVNALFIDIAPMKKNV